MFLHTIDLVGNRLQKYKKRLNQDTFKGMKMGGQGMRAFVQSASRGVYAFASVRLESQLRIQFRELRLMPIRVDRGRLACHIEALHLLRAEVPAYGL